MRVGATSHWLRPPVTYPVARWLDRQAPARLRPSKTWRNVLANSASSSVVHLRSALSDWSAFLKVVVLVSS